EQRRERIACEIGIFLLAQRGQWVEPLELRIDKARMAHDQSVCRQRVEKARKQRREIGAATKIIGAGEGGIGADAAPGRAGTKAAAEEVEHQAFGSGKPCAHAATWSHPSSGRELRRHLDHRVANLRRELYVLVSIDEIRRLAKRGDESLQLMHHLCL